jgi:hypothetical protein
VGVGELGGDLSVTYLTDLVGTTGNTSQSFTGVSFGAANAARRIYVAIATASNTNGATISAVTIGGVTAQLLAAKNSSGTFNPSIHYLALADVPAGTTGTIDVTISATTTLSFTAFVYRVVNQQEPITSVLQQGFSNTLTSSTSSALTVTTQANGFVLGWWAASSARDATLSGGTRDTSGSRVAHSGHLVPTDGSSVTFTWSWSSNIGSVSILSSLKE